MNPPKPGQFRVEQDKSPFSSINRVIVVAIIVAALFVVVGLFRPTITKFEAIQAEVDELGIKIQTERARLDQLQKKIELVKTDPEYLELIARDIRPLMKPEETIFQVRDPSPPPTNP